MNWITYTLAGALTISFVYNLILIKKVGITYNVKGRFKNKGTISGNKIQLPKFKTEKRKKLFNLKRRKS